MGRSEGQAPSEGRRGGSSCLLPFLVAASILAAPGLVAMWGHVVHSRLCLCLHTAVSPLRVYAQISLIL